MKTIVVSAVNLNEAGTLTILRDCLSYLSELASRGEYKVIALVYKKDLANYPHIEYIETQWPKKRWMNRIWYEYVSMKKISQQLSPVYLWLSLHDTTPNVMADRQAVYCHNPFPFYKWRWKECFLAPKIVLFALFSKFIYQKNIHHNDYVIVQQQWIKDEFKRLFSLTEEKIIVALPEKTQEAESGNTLLKIPSKIYRFVFAASPNSHKNFEVLCEATQLLEKELGAETFEVYITVKGDENKYAAWLYRQWGKEVESLKYVGFLDKTSLFDYYHKSDCLVFPSKIETWGLPISEFSAFDKPMLLSDLPYAHETAAGSKKVGFFDPDNPQQLAKMMKGMMKGDDHFLSAVPRKNMKQPLATSWRMLFEILLTKK